MWLIPGKDIVGEGIVIEVPGFSIDSRIIDKARLVNNEGVIPI